MIEGVDYSATANANWDKLAEGLIDAGKHFAGRYAVGDKSPSGRGITRAEYNAMRSSGIDVFLYWQSSTNWMLGGYDAGVRAAQDAQTNIIGAGIPADIPVYFACDFDATPGQQELIDSCLDGAASIIGRQRVGIYGGYYVVKRCSENKSARWFAQTTAWSGGQLFPGVHLYQYAYNQFIAGTNCDWVRAYQANYGQAEFKPQPVNIYPKDMSRELAHILFGQLTKTFDGKKRTFEFDPNGPISRAWLAMINAQLKPGESYRNAIVGPITGVTRRGKDKRYWDIAFGGMPFVQYDSETNTVVEG